MNAEDVVQYFAEYARTGDVALLDQFSTYITAIREDVNMVLDPVTVDRCVTNLVNTVVSNRSCSVARNGLRVVLSPVIFRDARRVVNEFIDAPGQLFGRLTAYMRLVFSDSTEPDELWQCLCYFGQISIGGLRHSDALGSDQHLRSSMLAFMKGQFFFAHHEIQSKAVSTVAEFVRNSSIMQPSGYVLDWVKEGVIPTTIRAAVHCAKTHGGQESVYRTGLYVGCLLHATNRIRAAYRFGGGNQSNQARVVSETTFKIDLRDLSHATVILYNALESADAPVRCIDAVEATMELAKYLCVHQVMTQGTIVIAVPDMLLLERMLSFQPVNEPSAQHLICLMRQRARSSGQMCVEFACESLVRQVVTIGLPSVAAIVNVNPLPPPPPRPDKQRRCALPGCFASDSGLAATMKKCSRCKGAHYCSVQHQKEHWPEHKKHCYKA